MNIEKVGLKCKVFQITKEYKRTNQKGLSNEEYRLQINEILNQIEDNKTLRYFYMYIFEKTRGML